jgi:hypothetical protein
MYFCHRLEPFPDIRTSSGDLDVTPWLLWFLEQVQAAIRSSESLVAAIVQNPQAPDE